MELTTDIFSLFDKKWALLTAGDRTSFNSRGSANSWLNGMPGIFTWNHGRRMRLPSGTSPNVCAA